MAITAKKLRLQTLTKKALHKRGQFKKAKPNLKILPVACNTALGLLELTFQNGDAIKNI